MSATHKSGENKANRFTKSKPHLNGPTHLRDIYAPIPDDLVVELYKTDFHPTIAWLRLIQTQEGHDQFKILFYGNKL